MSKWIGILPENLHCVFLSGLIVQGAEVNTDKLGTHQLAVFAYRAGVFEQTIQRLYSQDPDCVFLQDTTELQNPDSPKIDPYQALLNHSYWQEEPLNTTSPITTIPAIGWATVQCIFSPSTTDREFHAATEIIQKNPNYINHENDINSLLTRIMKWANLNLRTWDLETPLFSFANEELGELFGELAKLVLTHPDPVIQNIVKMHNGTKPPDELLEMLLKGTLTIVAFEAQKQQYLPQKEAQAGDRETL